MELGKCSSAESMPRVFASYAAESSGGFSAEGTGVIEQLRTSVQGLPSDPCALEMEIEVAISERRWPSPQQAMAGGQKS